MSDTIPTVDEVQIETAREPSLPPLAGPADFGDLTPHERPVMVSDFNALRTEVIEHCRVAAEASIAACASVTGLATELERLKGDVSTLKHQRVMGPYLVGSAALLLSLFTALLLAQLWQRVADSERKPPSERPSAFEERRIPLFPDWILLTEREPSQAQ